MEAIKKIVKIPKDHEIRIKVPNNIPENETVEVIVIFNDRKKSFEQKIIELKSAAKNQTFIDDVNEVSDDFKDVDSEGLD